VASIRRSLEFEQTKHARPSESRSGALKVGLTEIKDSAVGGLWTRRSKKRLDSLFTNYLWRDGLEVKARVGGMRGSSKFLSRRGAGEAVVFHVFGAW